MLSFISRMILLLIWWGLQNPNSFSAPGTRSMGICIFQDLALRYVLEAYHMWIHAWTSSVRLQLFCVCLRASTKTKGNPQKRLMLGGWRFHFSSYQSWLLPNKVYCFFCLQSSMNLFTLFLSLSFSLFTTIGWWRWWNGNVKWRAADSSFECFNSCAFVKSLLVGMRAYRSIFCKILNSG